MAEKTVQDIKNEILEIYRRYMEGDDLDKAEVISKMIETVGGHHEMEATVVRKALPKAVATVEYLIALKEEGHPKVWQVYIAENTDIAYQIVTHDFSREIPMELLEKFNMDEDQLMVKCIEAKSAYQGEL